MDICTWVVVTTMTMQMCWTDNVCRPSADGTKHICSGVQPKSCGMAGPTLECKKQDGSTYYITGNEAIREFGLQPLVGIQ